MEINNLREYQKMQLPLIEKIDEICQKQGLKYYLIGGTLLGAVRHKGFIPWDFDMDIAMPRKDYELFKEYWKNKQDPIFFYQDFETEKKHFSPHALLRLKNTEIRYNIRQISKTKYRGLYIDIFPLDEPPADAALQEKQAKRIKRIKGIFGHKVGFCYNNNVLKTLAKFIVSKLLSPITFRHLGKQLNKLMTAYTDSGSGYLVSMASHYSYKKQLMRQEVYGEPVRLEFEGLMLCCPQKYEEYLKALFGDYMKLPPEETRYSELKLIKEVVSLPETDIK